MNRLVLRNLIVLVVLGGVGVGLMGIPAPAYPNAADLTEVAIGAYKAGDPRLANWDFQDALAADPQNFRANYGFGLDWLAQKRYDESLRYLQRAQQIQPGNEEVQISLGACYQNMGQYVQAEPIYEALLKAHPDEPRVLNNLGQVEAKLGHTAQARTLLSRYLELQPQAGDRDFIKQTLAKLNGHDSKKAS